MRMERFGDNRLGCYKKDKKIQISNIVRTSFFKIEMMEDVLVKLNPEFLWQKPPLSRRELI
jgi:hypothetical protein